jgi:hypothetical protein
LCCSEVWSSAADPTSVSIGYTNRQQVRDGLDADFIHQRGVSERAESTGIQVRFMRPASRALHGCQRGIVHKAYRHACYPQMRHSLFSFRCKGIQNLIVHLHRERATTVIGSRWVVQATELTQFTLHTIMGTCSKKAQRQFQWVLSRQCGMQHTVVSQAGEKPNPQSRGFPSGCKLVIRNRSDLHE